MVMVKFKENGRCGVFNLEQIKIRPCGKVVAPFLVWCRCVNAKLLNILSEVGDERI